MKLVRALTQASPSAVRRSLIRSALLLTAAAVPAAAAAAAFSLPGWVMFAVGGLLSAAAAR